MGPVSDERIILCATIGRLVKKGWEMACIKKVLMVERSYERSRLEGECVASAYDILLPIKREELIVKSKEAVDVKLQWSGQMPARSAVGA